MPTTSARRLTSLFRRSSEFVECSLVLCGRREGHVGEHVVLAVVHELAELGPAFPELVGDVAPGLSGNVLVGLEEGLAQRG